MENTLLQQGVDLLLYGMGSVLVFLTLLVLATLAMSGVMMRYFQAPEPALPDADVGGAAGPVVDDRTLAIVQAAIDQHRKKRQR